MIYTIQLDEIIILPHNLENEYGPLYISNSIITQI